MLILRQPWKAQPQSRPRPSQWALDRKLAALYIPGFGQELVSGATWIVEGTPTIEYFGGLRALKTATNRALRVVLPKQTTNEFTLIGYTQAVSPGTDERPAGFGNSATNNTLMNHNCGSTDARAFRLFTRNDAGASQIVDGASLTAYDGNPRTIAYTYGPAGGFVWVDGVVDANSLPSAGAVTGFTVNQYCVGANRRVTTGNYWSGLTGWQAGFLKQLPFEDHERIRLDPWGMLLEARRIVVPMGTAAAGATAPGTTLTATASLIPGTATGQINATAAGVTLTVTSSLTAGAATGQQNATATGQTLTATASLIAGSASGQANATASGQTLTATASLVPGAATGQQNATASGQTLTATASLIPGTATGGNAGTAAGATLTATASLIPGAATGQQNATAPGVTLTAGVSLIAGSASAANDATASGVVIQATASFIAGTATGNAGGTAAGATMTATVTFIAGGAYGPTLASTPGFRVVGRKPMFTARIGPDGRSLPRRRAS